MFHTFLIYFFFIDFIYATKNWRKIFQLSLMMCKFGSKITNIFIEMEMLIILLLFELISQLKKYRNQKIKLNLFSFSFVWEWIKWKMLNYFEKLMSIILSFSLSENNYTQEILIYCLYTHTSENINKSY